MKTGLVIFPRRVRRGFFALIMLIITIASSAPNVEFSLTRNGSICRVKIYGKSIGTIKSGEIVCQYTPLLDIDEALVYSPLASLIVGASIDRINYRVRLALNTTANLSIENCELVVIDLKLSGSEKEPFFTVSGASFTDPQGKKTDVEIIPVGIKPKHPVVKAKRESKTETYFLLNGAVIGKSRADMLHTPNGHRDIYLRVVKR